MEEYQEQEYEFLRKLEEERLDRRSLLRTTSALLLLSLAGILIFFALSLVSHLLLRRWHESALAREV